MFKSLIILLTMAITIWPNELSQLEKFKSVITTEFKGYSISDTESIQL